MLPDYDLKALERRCREYPTSKTSRGMDYTPPIHWAKRADGVWIYEGDRHLVTLTPAMVEDGLVERLMEVTFRAAREAR